MYLLWGCFGDGGSTILGYDYLELYGANAQNTEQLQNTPQLIYMSLNKNSVYCVMPRSSKPPDTCK